MKTIICIIFGAALFAQPAPNPNPFNVDVYLTVKVTDEWDNPLNNIAVTGENLAYYSKPLRYPQPVGGVTGHEGRFTFHWKARYLDPVLSGPTANPVRIPGYAPGPLPNENDRLFGGPNIATFTDPNGKYATAKGAWQFVWVGEKGVVFMEEQRDVPKSGWIYIIKMKKK
jgi:hypothetical protein